ncbi:hypothetical protein Emag_000142 [Eimeria magna]
MAAADSNGPFRLLGYHRHVTSLQLAANHPFYEETEGRCLDTEVTAALTSAVCPVQSLLIKSAAGERRHVCKECLWSCQQELKIRAIELGAVSAVHPLLKPGAGRGPHAGDALKREDPVCMKRLDEAEPQVSVYADDKGNSRFKFLADTPLQRACCVYLAGRNAKSPTAAWGLHAVGGSDSHAAVQAAVLQLLVSLSRSAAAREEMQRLRVFQEAAELFVSHSLPQIREATDWGSLHSAAPLLRLKWWGCSMRPRLSLAARLLSLRQPAARDRMVTSSLVPAATRLLWLLEPELSCIEEDLRDGASDAVAAVSLEGLGEPGPMPALTAALETASMSVGASPTRVAAASGPRGVRPHLSLWSQAEAEASEEETGPLVQQLPMKRGELLPLVVQLLRSACAVSGFQRELYKHLRRRRQVMYEVLGVAAMKPAAALLAEALERMQLKERDLLRTELDEPHDGWLRFLVESDYSYKDACTDALQEGPTAARWARRFVPGIEGSLTKAKNAENLGLRAAASACIQLMGAS